MNGSFFSGLSRIASATFLSFFSSTERRNSARTSPNVLFSRLADMLTGKPSDDKIFQDLWTDCQAASQAPPLETGLEFLQKLSDHFRPTKGIQKQQTVLLDGATLFMAHTFSRTPLPQAVLVKEGLRLAASFPRRRADSALLAPTIKSCLSNPMADGALAQRLDDDLALSARENPSRMYSIIAEVSDIIRDLTDDFVTPPLIGRIDSNTALMVGPMPLSLYNIAFAAQDLTTGDITYNFSPPSEKLGGWSPLSQIPDNPAWHNFVIHSLHHMKRPSYDLGSQIIERLRSRQRPVCCGFGGGS